VRQGCISLGKVKCDSCGVTIPHSERYLMTDEEQTGEEENSNPAYYCLKCSQEKGYATYREEKGVTVITFFPIEEQFTPEGFEKPESVENPEGTENT